MHLSSLPPVLLKSMVIMRMSRLAINFAWQNGARCNIVQKLNAKLLRNAIDVTQSYKIMLIRCKNKYLVRFQFLFHQISTSPSIKLVDNTSSFGGAINKSSDFAVDYYLFFSGFNSLMKEIARIKYWKNCFAQKSIMFTVSGEYQKILQHI